MQTTLDNAGYTYNPFTGNDIWGRPADINLTPITSKELPVGADDGALPEFSKPYLRRGDVTVGSDHSAAWNPAAQTRQNDQLTNLVYLGAFAAVLAVALFR